MTSPSPPRLPTPVRSLGKDDKQTRFCEVTCSEQNEVAIVPPHDVFVFALSDEAVIQLRADLKEMLGYAQRRRSS